MTILDLNGPPSETRVVVAMSGGVDSSVVAAMLKQAGYDVVGLTLQLYNHGEAAHRAGSCRVGQDIHDARNVTEGLGIPYPTCIECNRKNKFFDFHRIKRKQDYILPGRRIHVT